MAIQRMVLTFGGFCSSMGNGRDDDVTPTECGATLNIAALKPLMDVANSRDIWHAWLEKGGVKLRYVS